MASSSILATCRYIGVGLLLCLTVPRTAGSSNSLSDLHKSRGQDADALKAYMEELRLELQAVKHQLGRMNRNSKLVRTSLKELKAASRCHDKELADYPRVDCPYGFDLSTPSSCYKLMPERLTWGEAAARCAAIKAHLVALESDAEQRLISNQLSHLSKLQNCDVWTSATDAREEGVWRWNATGNRVVTSHWHAGEPNDSGGREDCAWLDWYFGWAWNDAACDRDKACFICEIDL